MAKRSSPEHDSPPRAYHHGNLRRALIDAALELIVQHGVQSFTLREVARRAGVSHAAPYRHFADRAALIGATAQHVVDELCGELREAERSSEGGGRLRSVLEAYLRYALARPARFLLAFGREAAPTLDTSELVEVFRRAAVNSQPAGSDGARATSTWAAAHGTAVLAIDRRLGVDDPALLAKQLAGVLGGSGRPR